LTEIKIIQSYNITEFEEILNDELKKSLKLHEGMEVSSIYRNAEKTIPHEQKTFYQMLIKEK